MSPIPHLMIVALAALLTTSPVEAQVSGWKVTDSRRSITSADALRRRRSGHGWRASYQREGAIITLTVGDLSVRLKDEGAGAMPRLLAVRHVEGGAVPKGTLAVTAWSPGEVLEVIVTNQETPPVRLAWDFPGPAKVVDNPAWAAWAAFGVGSRVTTAFRAPRGGGGMRETRQTTELTARTDDLITLTTTGGRRQAVPRQITIYPQATVKRKPDAGVETRGVGVLTIAGQQVECSWVKRSYGGAKVLQTWRSPQVPGGFVRQDDSRIMMSIRATVVVAFVVKPLAKR